MVYIAERHSGEAEGALPCRRGWGQHSLAGGLLCQRCRGAVDSGGLFVAVTVNWLLGEEDIYLIKLTVSSGLYAVKLDCVHGVPAQPVRGNGRSTSYNETW